MPRLEFLANMNISPLTVEGLRFEIVSEMEKELEEGIVVSVDETSARYRNLPIEIK